MMRIFSLIFILVVSQSAFAGAGIAAGAFADSFSKGMQQNAVIMEQQAAIRQMRLEARARYGTRQIVRMDFLEKQADVRMDEILKGLVTEIHSKNNKGR